MPTRGEAFEFLTREGPAIFGNVGSMLYVGHRHDTHPWWHQTFAPSIGASRLAVIDIDRGNLATAQSITNELYLGDIRQSDSPRDFGLIFWDEGPEHLPKDEAFRTIKFLGERGARVLVSCPWGFQKQGDDPHHPEFHHWGPLPEDFLAAGMSVRTFGTSFDVGPNGGNLIAWT